MEDSFRSRSFLGIHDVRKNTRAFSRVSEKEPQDLAPDELAAFKELKNLLSLPPFKRTKQHLKSIVDFLRKTKFDGGIKTQQKEYAYHEMARYIKHYYSSLKSFRYRIPNEPSRFYIIINGEVLIHKDSGSEDPVHLKKYDSFGEHFEKTDENFRVTCLGPTHFAVLDSIDFKRINEHLLEKKFQIVLNFLRTIPTLKALSRKYVEKILGFFYVTTFRRKEYVFREKDPSDKVYFIEQGEFMILKHSRMSSLSPLREGKEKVEKKYRATQAVAMISKGEILGEEDVLNKNHLRTYSCQCYSDKGITMFISSSNFFEYLAKYNDVIQIMKERIQVKEKERSFVRKKSEEIIKMRLPRPLPPPIPGRPPFFSPKNTARLILVRSGHNSPSIRSGTPV